MSNATLSLPTAERQGEHSLKSGRKGFTSRPPISILRQSLLAFCSVAVPLTHNEL
jgi:hypothetical protein